MLPLLRIHRLKRLAQLLTSLSIFSVCVKGCEADHVIVAHYESLNNLVFCGHLISAMGVYQVDTVQDHLNLPNKGIQLTADNGKALQLCNGIVTEVIITTSLNECFQCSLQQISD